MHFRVVNRLLVKELGTGNRAVTVGIHELFEDMRYASCMLMINANWIFRCFWKVGDPAFASFVDLIDEALVVTIILAVVIKVP